MRHTGGWAFGENLDQVKTHAARLAQRFIEAHDPDLLVGYSVDNTHFAGANAFIDSNIF